jgi:chemotaxis protein MotB
MKWLTVVALMAWSGCVSQSKHDKVRKQLADAEARAAACSKESGERQTELTACRAGKQSAEQESAKLDETMKATASELTELRKQREDTDRRLAAFQALTAKFQKMIDTGTLRVRVRNGRMLLELPAGVLFASGKAELQPKGNQALTAVAGVLKELADRHFLVAGHTDSDPIKDSPFSDNWELSVARALTVTKFLVTAGMDPHSLAAAGYSEYDPAARNKSKRGKQLNRRIEIVLEPRIDELPHLPESSE